MKSEDFHKVQNFYVFKHQSNFAQFMYIDLIFQANTKHSGIETTTMRLWPSHKFVTLCST